MTDTIIINLNNNQCGFIRTENGARGTSYSEAISMINFARSHGYEESYTYFENGDKQYVYNRRIPRT